jgi:hypothetical protein
MARWWISIWLANVAPHGARHMRRRGTLPPPGADGSRLRPGRSPLLVGLAIGAVALAILALVLIWQHARSSLRGGRVPGEARAAQLR